MKIEVAEETKPLTGKHSFAEGNRFYILGVFDDELLKEIVVPMTREIDKLTGHREAGIEVYINSPGGNGYIVMHLIRLFELAKRRGIIVRTIVPQYAYSAGSMLAIAGTKGERYIGETAEHCVHYGQQYGWMESTPLQIQRNTEFKQRWFKQLADHYKKYTKIPKLDEALKDDSFFIPAKDCIKWGVADKYMGDLL